MLSIFVVEGQAKSSERKTKLSVPDCAVLPSVTTVSFYRMSLRIVSKVWKVTKSGKGTAFSRGIQYRVSVNIRQSASVHFRIYAAIANIQFRRFTRDFFSWLRNFQKLESRSMQLLVKVE